MKAEYVNPFYQATINVFKMMLDLEVTKNLNSIPDSKLSDEKINILIQVTGDLTGFIIYSFDSKMPLEMVKIMSGMQFDEFDSFVESAIMEIANIISGNALSNLSKQRWQCDITPPQVYTENSKPLELKNKRVLRIPLQTKLGNLQLCISLEETKAS